MVLVDGVVGGGGWVEGGVGWMVKLSPTAIVGGVGMVWVLVRVGIGGRVGVGGVGLAGLSMGGGGGDCGGGGRGIPHPSSMTGCFQVFFFLRGEASGVCWASSAPPPWSILLLDGDILTPFPLPTSRSS